MTLQTPNSVHTLESDRAQRQRSGTELGLEGPSSQDPDWSPRKQSFISRPGGLYLDTARSGVP